MRPRSAMALPFSRACLGRQERQELLVLWGRLGFSPHEMHLAIPSNDLPGSFPPDGGLGFSPHEMHLAIPSNDLPGSFPPGGQRYQLCCAPKHGQGCEALCALKGLLCEKRTDFADRTCHTGPAVKDVDYKPPLHQRVPNLKQSMPFYLSKRHLSSNPNQDDVICMEGFPGPGPGDTKLLLQNVEVEVDKIKDELDIDSLKAEFEREIRPLFASHCLMLPDKIDHMSTAFLDGQAHKFSRLKTVFLSSLDIMIRLKSLKEWQRKPLLEFLIKRRVFVADEWEVSYGNIELLEYDFEEDNTEFVRGECDAAFTPSALLCNTAGATASGAINQAGGATASGAIHQAGGATASGAIHQAVGGPASGAIHQAAGGPASGAIHQAAGGTAKGAVIQFGIGKLAIIIWKGRRLVWAEVFDGIECKNNNHAEVLAALALLMKCEEMKFDKVKLWSDSARAIGCINGSETIQMDKEDCHTYLLLRSMHTKFEKLVAVRKSRELMFLADQFLKFEGFASCVLDEAIELQSAYLSGYPLFSLTRNYNTSLVIKSFPETLEKKEDEGYVHENGSTFYYKVSKANKFEEFQRIKTALRASCAEVVLDSSKLNSEHLEQLSDSMCAAKKKTISQTAVSLQDNFSPNTDQRTLVIVWDASVPWADYHREDACTIIFTEDDEVLELEKVGIIEVNPSTYFCFNRVVHQYTPRGAGGKGKKKSTGALA